MSHYAVRLWTRAGIGDECPLTERLCPLCMRGMGNEKHLVFDGRFAMNDICFRFSQLFMDLQTITAFINQAAQRDIKHLINVCART